MVFVYAMAASSDAEGYRGRIVSIEQDSEFLLIFIDGPVNHSGMKATLPDFTGVTERGKAFSADYLNVLRTAEHAVPVLIDHRLDTRWKTMELRHGSLTECYYYGAMKFKIMASPQHIEALKRLPIEIVDTGEPLYLPVGQNPPP